MSGTLRIKQLRPNTLRFGTLQALYTWFGTCRHQVQLHVGHFFLAAAMSTPMSATMCTSMSVAVSATMSATTMIFKLCYTYHQSRLLFALSSFHITKQPCGLAGSGKKPTIILNPFLILYQHINNISDIISISQYHDITLAQQGGKGRCYMP